MAKTRAPLLGFGASGQIGKTIVFGSWKGVGYARQHVIPANPQTAEQDLTRNLFGWIQAVYKQAPALFTDPWDAYARGKQLTARNAFGKFNISSMREETDLLLLQFSPGALGGLPGTALAVTGGNDVLTFNLTVPTTLPQGWTITSVSVAAIKAQDPQSGTDYQLYADEKVGTPYTAIALTVPAGDYECGAWIKWLRADGQVAYSPSINDTATAT